MTLPTDLAVDSSSEEADVVHRVFAGRRWQDCPWYLFDLDPALVSAVEREFTIRLAWGYIAAGKSSEDVLNRLADRVEPFALSGLDAALEAEVRLLLSAYKSDDSWREAPSDTR